MVASHRIRSGGMPLAAVQSDVGVGGSGTNTIVQHNTELQQYMYPTRRDGGVGALARARVPRQSQIPTPIPTRRAIGRLRGQNREVSPPPTIHGGLQP